jgi:hypothetical protein
MHTLNRLGSFIAFLGAGSIILFVLSEISMLPDYRFLFWGIGLIIVGSGITMLFPKKDAIKSTRFRVLRGRDEDS